jgi:predicted GNAT family acetyltransferase
LVTASSTTATPESGSNSDDPVSRHVLDDCAWQSLTGHHARFAERFGHAIRYRSDVAFFASLGGPGEEHSWHDAARLVGPQGTIVLFDVSNAPEGWETFFVNESVQLVDTALRTATADPEMTVLGPRDVPEILDLIARTEPGPFRQRTIELGTYLGIRRDGRLVAMAGERQRPPGWTEISAVCTDEAYRGQGLATRLVQAVAAGIRERGETPFMHVLGANTDALRLYASMGFTLRRNLRITGFRRTS